MRAYVEIIKILPSQTTCMYIVRTCDSDVCDACGCKRVRSSDECSVCACRRVWKIRTFRTYAWHPVEKTSPTQTAWLGDKSDISDKKRLKMSVD